VTRIAQEEGLPEGWHPDVDVDAAHLTALLEELPAELAHVRGLPLRFVAEGWDNSVWRVGSELVARVPRRPLAASLVLNEARWLDPVAAPLKDRGVMTPRVVHLSSAGRHPHPWLLVTWVPGELLEGAPIADRDSLVAPLAAALAALHRPAPEAAPSNPFRGPDLRDMPAPRGAVVAAARDRLGVDAVTGLQDALAAAVAAPRWPGRRVWCHGDLHPRNLVTTPVGGLGVLDFGDLTAGDPAVDLSVLWLAFDAEQRARCLAALAADTSAGAAGRDDHVTERARGWAARFVLGVAAQGPESFEHTLRHAVSQLLG
jgi:aminoglycoside phosphotransferase (APT) family kinase protein